MRNIRIGKNTSNNKKTGLYIRVSTNFQFEEGYSVGAQTEKLEKYCNYQEIDNYDLYIDGGYSGSNLNRPEMKRLIKEIQEGKVESVVVVKLDRLSRSQKDTIYLLEDVFEANDVGFISLNENFDTTTPYGRLFHVCTGKDVRFKRRQASVRYVVQSDIHWKAQI